MAAKPELTRFNLDFPGGKPRELVTTIQKAMGKPLNAIVPEENADVVLPALKMNNVTVPQLFKALEQASVKQVAFTPARLSAVGVVVQVLSRYTIRTTASTPPAQKPTIRSGIFMLINPPVPPLIAPKACKFYSLAPYLEHGAECG